MSTLEREHSGNKVHAVEDNQCVTSSSSGNRPMNLCIPAFIVALLFNHVLGFFGLYFTVTAQHNWQNNNCKKAKKQSCYAKVLLVLGFLVGIVTYFVAIYLYLTITSDTDGTTTVTTTAIPTTFLPKD